ncbi:MAG TPA: TIR domain-containing protein, partial [Bacteroidetes bacterium]|nr:TIR domain-containing protein [Bacteroidota bacterium]
MKKDIFISHASEDKHTIIEPLVQILEQNGISYWYDNEDIGWGDNI